MLDDLRDLNAILSMPPLEWAIETLLPRAGICILAGTPKAGKSVVVLDNLLRGMQGRTAFGRFKQIYQKALVVNVEGRHQGIKMRDSMYEGASEDVKSRIFVSGKPIKFTHPNGGISNLTFDQLGTRILAEGFDLVVLDPLVSFHSADENDSQAMVEVLDALRDVGERTRAAFIVLHHTRKLASAQTLEDAIEQGGDMMRGAGGIFGAVDAAVLVWKCGKRRLFTFAPRYARPGANLEPIEMQIDTFTMRMYPIEGEVPSPREWIADNSLDWQRYALAFGLGADSVQKAKRLL